MVGSGGWEIASLALVDFLFLSQQQQGKEKHCSSSSYSMQNFMIDREELRDPAFIWP